MADRNPDSHGHSCAHISESGVACSFQALENQDVCLWHSNDPGPSFADVSQIPSGGEIHEAKVSGVDLSEVEITDTTFISPTFEAVTIRESNLDGTKFIEADFEDVVFDACSFKAGGFRECALSKVALYATEATEAIFSEITAEQLDIRGGEISRAQFDQSTIKEFEFTDTTGNGATLREVYAHHGTIEDSSFVEADFSRAALAELRIEDTDLTEANFNKASLEGCTVHLASLPRTSFRDASLVGFEAVRSDFDDAQLEAVEAPTARFDMCSFRQARLNRSRLSDAELVDSECIECEFNRADCNQVNFERSDLSGADFRGADISEARLERTKLGQLRIDAQTLMEPVYAYGPDSTDLRSDERIFRELADVAATNGLSRQAQEFRYRSKNAQRQAERTQFLKSTTTRKRLTHMHRYFALLVSGLVTGHGERPVRVLYSGMVVIYLFAGLYYLLGGVADSATASVRPGENTDYLLDAIIFSVSSFAGTEGELVATTQTARLLASFESLVGIVFIVLFVVVLTRRTMRFS